MWVHFNSPYLLTLYDDQACTHSVLPLYSGDYESSSGAHQQRGSGDAWQENRIVYSINQLFSQVTDMQAALQVTVDQVYAITQHLDNTNTTAATGSGVNSANNLTAAAG